MLSYVIHASIVKLEVIFNTSYTRENFNLLVALYIISSLKPFVIILWARNCKIILL